MVRTQLHGRHWISPETEWTDEEVSTVLEVAFDLKKKMARNEPHELLRAKTLFMIWYNPSTRTRNSFEAGMTQLGGHAHDLTTEKLQIAHGESIRDTSAIISRYGHGIAIRRYIGGVQYGEGNLTIREYAKYATVPVVNMECDIWHPCQGVADLMTVKEKWGDLKGKKFVMSWAYGPGAWKPLAVPQTNIVFFTRFGMDVTLAYPEKFDLDPAVITYTKSLADRYGTKFEIVHDMKEAFEGAHVVYPKGWCSWELLEKGGFKEGLHEEYKKEKKLQNWKTTVELMDIADKRAIYMHCLPADRGDEVDNDVIDGKWSVVVDEAENRLHGQKGIMALTMGGLP